MQATAAEADPFVAADREVATSRPVDVAAVHGALEGFGAGHAESRVAVLVAVRAADAAVWTSGVVPVFRTVLPRPLAPDDLAFGCAAGVLNGARVVGKLPVSGRWDEVRKSWASADPCPLVWPLAPNGSRPAS